MTNTQPPRQGVRCIRLIAALIFTLLVSLSWLVGAGSAAEDSPVVNELRQKAQHAYTEGRYADAVAANLEIAEKHPDSDARHNAVQMLGNIYEDNLIDLKEAIKWDGEFLEEYADSRQVPFYEEKIATLEKLLNQEPAFKTWQAIRSSNDSDESLVKKYEALLRDQPDFVLKDKVESELGHAYGRMDKLEKSYLAFQSIASEGGEKKLSSTDLVAYEDAHRYLRMTGTWAWFAWAFIVTLWTGVLLMKPWKRLAWASSKKFILLPVLWVLMTIACIPFYYSMDTTAYPIQIPITTVFVAAGLNLIVLFWLLLLTRGEFWRTRPWALRLCSPVLTLLMTVAVFYLFVVYQPQGPYITDVFAVKLHYWSGELRNRGLSLAIPGR
ncbi:conserved membrane hypothetical protein [Syntrophobacter sp. SbD1]|nr:conserved membrane hypothetical protein [Syntrophobacter sp. SbD1]